jgi:hypothetical protein
MYYPIPVEYALNKSYIKLHFMNDNVIAYYENLKSRGDGRAGEFSSKVAAAVLYLHCMLCAVYYA